MTFGEGEEGVLQGRPLRLANPAGGALILACRSLKPLGIGLPLMAEYDMPGFHPLGLPRLLIAGTAAVTGEFVSGPDRTRCRAEASRPLMGLMSADIGDGCIGKVTTHSAGLQGLLS